MDQFRKTCKRYNSPGDAHFLTFSCFRRQAFLTNERTLTWLADSVTSAGIKHDVALWGYVFMPEHVHLLVKPRSQAYSISRYLFSVKESVTRKAVLYREKSTKPDTAWERFYDIGANGKMIFRFWQRGGGYDRNIFTDEELREKLEYMHDNPVKRGLCGSPIDWRWSSAGFYVSGLRGPLDVEIAEL